MCNGSFSSRVRTGCYVHPFPKGERMDISRVAHMTFLGLRRTGVKNKIMERGSRKRQKTSSDLLDVEKFLFELRGSVVMNDEGTQFSRVIGGITNESYQNLLTRAWCIWRMLESGLSKQEMIKILGSKAKYTTTRYSDAMGLCKLIVVHKMWKLRFLNPTRTQLKTLLYSMNSFNKYFKDHSDPFWQTNEEIPQDYNEWVKK